MLNMSRVKVLGYNLKKIVTPPLLIMMYRNVSKHTVFQGYRKM